MQQAISYKSWLPIHTNNTLNRSSSIGKQLQPTTTSSENFVKGSAEDVRDVVKENAVIVFGKRGCCMSHVVKRLLLGLGVNPAVYEVDDEDENKVVQELDNIGRATNTDDDDDGRRKLVQFPAVFIGGSLFGGLDRVMATHITGELVPILKEAGALWL